MPMTIATFSNYNDESLFLIVEPGGDRYEIPHLGKGGIRYVLAEGQEDRPISNIGRDEIRFWCDAKSYEVEIVHPAPYDLLHWDLCARNGFCGGLRNDEPIHVRDVLPTEGMIRAEEFAELLISVQCERRSPERQHRRWVAFIAGKFVEYLGASVMPIEALKMNHRLPFEPCGERV